MISALVLAAGESTRMGKPKPLLRFGNRTFLGQIIAILRGSDVDRTTVVLGAQAELIKETVDLPAVDVVINRDYRQGQLSSLQAGLKKIPTQVEAILLCLVDGPFITAEIVNKVVATFRDTDAAIVIPTFEGRRGHPSLFACSMFEELRNAPADQGARHVVYTNEHRVVEVEIADRGVLTGINTPEDYRSRFGVDP
jgi:molybdenum cofactor cytidylyltransferase